MDIYVNLIQNVFMNIKEEIQIILLKKKLSMRKLVELMNQDGFNIGTIQNLSNKFRNKTIRFYDIVNILKILGYRLKIEKIEK